MQAYKSSTREGIESSLSKARNAASKPLAKDEFGVNEFDFAGNGPKTQRKILNSHYELEVNESPKIDIFSSRDEGENHSAEIIGDSKSPLTQRNYVNSMVRLSNV